MAKKITAPHSYDPGKGRPKEYLAYLNEREMAYLRSINGNNMERGPRGLPSFPPEDAVGSSSKAGSKGPGGPSGPNSGPSRSGSPSTGGGGKGPGGPSGPNSGPSGGLGGGSKGAPGSSPSSPGGLRGAGGNYGPGSGRPGTTSSAGGGYKGPSSPMGGQGPSFSNDTKAQQEAQVRDAIKAVKNSPAFRNDASSGGIRTLNVGPIGTPVNVGPRVSPTQNRTSVAGGWGVAGVGIAQRGLPSFVSPSTSGRPGGEVIRDMVSGYSMPSVKQFTDRVPIGKQFGVLGEGYDERIAPEPSPSTSISSQFPNYKYDSPLTPGMTPEDMARRGALMDQYEREIRDIQRGTPTSTGNPNMAGNPPAGQTRKENPLAGTGYGTFNIAGVDRVMAAPEDLPPEKTPTDPRDRSFSNSFISSAAAATPGSVDLMGAGYGTFNVPSKPTISKEEQRSLDIQNQSLGLDGIRPYREPSERTLDRLNEVFKENGLRPSGKTRGIGDAEPSMNNEFSGIESSGEIVRDGEFGYPTNADGSPITAEDIANMPEDIQKEYFDKVRYSRNYDTPYPLTKAEKEKGFVAGVVTSPLRRGPVGALLKGLKYVPGGLGEAAENLSNPRKAVNEYDRLDPLKKQQMRERAGKDRGFGGGSTSTTSPGGGITDIGSGGKNEPPRISPVEKETPKTPAKPKEGGPRPSIYYKWDLGVDVPSPTDSDYTLYLKYLQEKAAAKAGFA